MPVDDAFNGIFDHILGEVGTMRLRKRGSKVSNSPEAIYARGKTAGWLLKAMEFDIVLESEFFKCLQWVCGERRFPVRELLEHLQALGSAPGVALARKAVGEGLERPGHRLPDLLEDLADEHPCLRDSIINIARRECQVMQSLCDRPFKSYSTALKRLQRIFGMTRDCQALCEFAYINQTFVHVELYFKSQLEVDSYLNRRILANMLGLSTVQLNACRATLDVCGLLSSQDFQLRDFLIPFWESETINTAELFTRPLTGNALPLESFKLAPEDVAHIVNLLRQEGEAPVHILLYGPPGTGKTTFAYSLAQACGVKAWAVPSQIERNGIRSSSGSRLAALTACLHMTSKHEGAFVLVDEAERLLNTSYKSPASDKAWLNDFLEKPGQRIIWVSNRVEYIDPAVRRRFSFSVYFNELDTRQREDIWRQIIARQRVTRRIGDEQIKALAKNYPVEAGIINSAISQAKKLYCGKKDFVAGLERILTSQLTLQRNGKKPGKKMQAAPDFTLDGLCLEGSAMSLLEKCSRVDAVMRGEEPVRPGCGTMLFYGPPGTGKTALARYIAKKLERECIVKRASDLLSPWVGVAEKQVAAAFQQAESNGAVLVIDEADTFIYSRDIAQRSWETSLVNEFLTALEECRCFCICTTNRRAKLDAAAFRRFSHKVAFSYAGQEQVSALYAKLLAPICTKPLPPELEKKLLSLTMLTPGDFHAVRSQFDSLFVDKAGISHETLVDALAKEQAMKTEPRASHIGFIN